MLECFVWRGTFLISVSRTGLLFLRRREYLWLLFLCCNNLSASKPNTHGCAPTLSFLGIQGEVHMLCCEYRDAHNREGSDLLHFQSRKICSHCTMGFPCKISSWMYKASVQWLTGSVHFWKMTVSRDTFCELFRKVEWLDWSWSGLPKHLPKAPILSLPALT